MCITCPMRYRNCEHTWSHHVRKISNSMRMIFNLIKKIEWFEKNVLSSLRAYACMSKIKKNAVFIAWFENLIIPIGLSIYRKCLTSIGHLIYRFVYWMRLCVSISVCAHVFISIHTKCLISWLIDITALLPFRNLFIYICFCYVVCIMYILFLYFVNNNRNSKKNYTIRERKKERAFCSMSMRRTWVIDLSGGWCLFVSATMVRLHFRWICHEIKFYWLMNTFRWVKIDVRPNWFEFWCFVCLWFVVCASINIHM